MQLNMKESQQYTLKGDNEIFEETEFHKQDFTLTVEPLTRQVMADMTRSHTKRGKRGQEKTDHCAVGIDLFIRCVKAWTGFIDQDKKAIECSKENKRFIANRHFLFASAVTAEALDLNVAEEQEVKKELGNS